MFAAAYSLAYQLRFGPTCRRSTRTCTGTRSRSPSPALIILALFGAYRASGPLMLAKAVVVTTLALESYAAIVSTTAPAFAPLLPPAGCSRCSRCSPFPALLATRFRASARA
jgi:hypothetical protein